MLSEKKKAPNLINAHLGDVINYNSNSKKVGVVTEKSKSLSRNGLPEDAVAASAEDASVDCVVAAGKPTGLCSRSDAVRR